MASFSKTFNFNLRRDHQKKNVPKNDEKNNSVGKGLNVVALQAVTAASSLLRSALRTLGRMPSSASTRLPSSASTKTRSSPSSPPTM